MAKRKEKDPSNRMRKVTITTFVVFLLCAISYLFQPKVKLHQQYQKTIQQLETDIDELESQVAEMKKNGHDLQYNKNYARRIAHEQGLVEEGEVIYRFLDEPAP
jgi:cell division protein FtsB